MDKECHKNERSIDRDETRLYCNTLQCHPRNKLFIASHNELVFSLRSAGATDPFDPS